MNSIYQNSVQTNVPPPPSAASEMADSINLLECALLRLDGVSRDIESRLEPVMRQEPVMAASCPQQANGPVLAPLSHVLRGGAEQVDVVVERLNSVLRRLAL